MYHLLNASMVLRQHCYMFVSCTCAQRCKPKLRWQDALRRAKIIGYAMYADAAFVHPGGQKSCIDLRCVPALPIRTDSGRRPHQHSECAARNADVGCWCRRRHECMHPLMGGSASSLHRFKANFYGNGPAQSVI
jgi:hypothetical protein